MSQSNDPMFEVYTDWYRYIASFDSLEDCVRETGLTAEEVLRATSEGITIRALKIRPTWRFVEWMERLINDDKLWDFDLSIHGVATMRRDDIAKIKKISQKTVQNDVNKFRDRLMKRLVA